MSHAINGSSDLFDAGPTSTATYSQLPSSPNATRSGNVPPLAPLPLTTVLPEGPSPALPTPPPTPTLPPKKFSYWSLLLPLYVPGFFVFAAEAAWVVAMPMYMREKRYGDDALGIAIAAASVMAILTNLLAGYFITRFGCKMVQLGAMLAYAASGVILYLSMHFTLLIIGCLVKGIGWSLYRTSRSALMTVYIPPTHRGRSVGILGGCNRVSAVLGPLMTGFVAQHMSTSLSFLVITVCCVPSIIALSFTTMNYSEGEDPHAVEGSASARGSARGSARSMKTFNHPEVGSEPLLAPEETDAENPVASPPITPNTNATSPSIEFPVHQPPKGYHLLHVLWRVLVAHRKDFMFLGMFCLFFTVLRSGRDLILPLKAHDEGLKKDMVGSVVSACNAADSVSFPIAGILMDRYGRKFSGIPASLVLAIGFLAVPFVKVGWTLFGAAVILGLGNGLSSGIVMTIGTDLAPVRHRGEFLGLFLILEDGGRLVAPLLLGVLSEQINLGAAGYAFAIIGVGCAAWMWLACSETLRKEETRK